MKRPEVNASPYSSDHFPQQLEARDLLVHASDTETDPQEVIQTENTNPFLEQVVLAWFLHQAPPISYLLNKFIL